MVVRKMEYENVDWIKLILVWDPEVNFLVP